MSHVYVIGSLNNDIVVEVARFPVPGETIPGRALRTSLGGKGANQAVAVARAGGQVSFIGCRGDDAVGAALAATLGSEGVETTALALSSAPTGTAIITVDEKGENEVIGIMGANAGVSFEQVDAFDPHTKDLVLAQVEIPQPIVAKAFEKAKAVGALTILNAAPMQPLEPTLMEATDWLVVNEIEMATLAGVKDACVDPEMLGALAARVLYPSQKLIVTLGSVGAYFWQDGNGTMFQGYPTKAIDTTGAGDCFVGYFVAGLAQGMTPAQAIDRANKAASLSVTRPGAAVSVPHSDEL